MRLGPPVEGSLRADLLCFPSSPFMNKFFPVNFPNRQYQLLFTQGSGENKEGQCPPGPPWVSPTCSALGDPSARDPGAALPL